MDRFLYHIKILFSAMALIGYLFISIGFFWYTFNPSEHSGHHGMTHCSYVVGENVLCNMNIMDYINKWQQFFLVFFSNQNIINLLSFSIISVFFFIIILYFISKDILFLKKKVKPPLLYELLFSDGILNSKAY